MSACCVLGILLYQVLVDMLRCINQQYSNTFQFASLVSTELQLLLCVVRSDMKMLYQHFLEDFILAVHQYFSRLCTLSLTTLILCCIYAGVLQSRR